MEKIIFTEEFCQPEQLHPFTLTRQIQDIRVGILTIREKWERMLGLESFDRREDDYKDLDRSVQLREAVGNGTCYLIHGNVLPSPQLVKAVKKLRCGEFLSVNGNNNIAFCFSQAELKDEHRIKVNRAVDVRAEIRLLRYPWEIFQFNDQALRWDFDLLTARRKSQVIPRSNRVVNAAGIFIEKGARVEYSVLNASTGPIYIGRDAEIMEGCLIRGPFAMGERSLLKMGTKVYGATTLGPSCVGGGEIKNSVLMGYSNKAHDGYLGDSVLGEWCNLGAGTSNSNLKNNAGVVGVWKPAGQQTAGNKCGVLMGDYTRTAINTAINTGTVMGVSCNVFGSGLTPKYIPSFSWGSEGIRRYPFERALTDIAAWKKLKGKSLSAGEKSILQYIFAHF